MLPSIVTWDSFLNDLQERREGENGVAEMKWLSVEAHGRRLSKVADSSAYLSRKSCFTVVAKAIDDDLYGIPPDMLYQKPAGV